MAVVEVPKVKIEKIGIKPFHEFDERQRDLAARRPAGGDPRGARPSSARASRRPENRVLRRPHGRPRVGRLPG